MSCSYHEHDILNDTHLHLVLMVCRVFDSRGTPISKKLCSGTKKLCHIVILQIASRNPEYQRKTTDLPKITDKLMSDRIQLDTVEIR